MISGPGVPSSQAPVPQSAFMSISMPRRPAVPGPPGFQFRKAVLESLKGDIDDLYLTAGPIQKGLQIIDHVPFFSAGRQ